MDSDENSVKQASNEDARVTGTLYVVATPIGNLDDLSERTMQVLRKTAWIAAEDTRTTRVLLDRVGSDARSFAAHQHNEQASAMRILALLDQGEDVALVSDAGTPAISDPGARIVSRVLDHGARVVPIPGPSAAAAMVSASGLVDGAFHFEGFLPSKTGERDKRLAELARLGHPFVLFEAPHRIGATLTAIASICGDDRLIALGRELTKKFEEVHRCPAAAATAWLDDDPNRLRGEYVLVVEAAADLKPVGATVEPQALIDALLEELPPSRAVRVAMRVTGLTRAQLYPIALERARQREE